MNAGQFDVAPQGLLAPISLKGGAALGLLIPQYPRALSQTAVSFPLIFIYNHKSQFRLPNLINNVRAPKTLKRHTPYGYVCNCWTSQPERIKLNPLQKKPALNN